VNPDDFTTPSVWDAEAGADAAPGLALLDWRAAPDPYGCGAEHF